VINKKTQKRNLALFVASMISVVLTLTMIVFAKAYAALL